MGGWRRGICAAAAVSAVAAASYAPASPAAARPAPINARPSDHTPHVGEQFVVRGAYDPPGRRAHEVKIQTLRDDRWRDLDGTRVWTRADGSYRVRVVLFLRGVRDLRAVGIAGGGRRNSYARLVVQVLR
jgi:hypothetical protein